MKLSLALGPRRPPSRQTAWGCLTTNLAMPGFGTLLAGRKVGYFQVPFTLAGFALTLIGGIPAIGWGFKNLSRMLDSDDPVQNFREMWVHFRWPIAGMGLFVFALAWSMISSLSILNEAREAEAMRPLPPKIKK